MEMLNRHRDRLPTYEYGIEDPDDEVASSLVRGLDWRVQDDAATLDGASKDEVRRRFRQLVSDQLKPEESDEPIVSYMAESENPRWNFCVHVDRECLDSVLRDPSDGTIDPMSGQRFVNVIRADGDWETIDYDRFDWATHTPPEDPDEDDPHDEGEEQIEGSRRHDVGWMKVQVGDLIPSLYDDLMKRQMWHPTYVRPPEIAGWSAG